MPLQIRGPDIPIRGPKSFPLIVSGAVCGHFARPVPTYIVKGFALVLIDTAPPNLNKWVVFPEGPGYNQTFLFGTVLVFNSGPVKVCAGHRPIEGRICFFLCNGTIYKINQQNALIGQQLNALFLANHLFDYIGNFPLHVVGVCHTHRI